MTQKKFKEFRGKKVLVVGLGLHGGGVGTVKFLVDAGAQITVTDLRSREVLESSLQKLVSYPGVRYVLGAHREEDFLRAEMIVKNPGVPADSPYLRAAEERGIPVTSDMGIFFRLSPAEISIGVTGTRGKSTTSYLIWKFLKTAQERVYLVGNIRASVLDILAELMSRDIVVLELSSFQLEDLGRERVSPHVAVITNIRPDHLDRHASFEEYQRVKSLIFQFQGPQDFLFFDRDDAMVAGLAKRARSQRKACRLPLAFCPIVDQNLGVHYRSAVGLAIGVAKHFNISDLSIQKVLEDFRGLEGREQEVAVVGGIRCINDTTATSPDAAQAAIERFRARQDEHKLILIAGGQDKGLDFRELAHSIQQYVDVLILLPGTATQKLKESLGVGDPSMVREVSSMSEAVQTAYQFSAAGDCLLLSPGAASFGLFLNEFDRGDQFVKAIRKLE